MRVLMISDVYFPRINGVSTSIQTFRDELHSAGVETVLVAPEYPQGGAREDAGIVRVASRQVPLDPEDRLMKPTALHEALRSLRNQRFDLLHIHTPFVAHRYGVRLGRELGLPILETYHTFFEEYLYHYIPFLPKALLRYGARRFSRRQCNEVDAVVVPSRAMYKVLSGYGVKAPMHIIPTGIRLAAFCGGDGARFRQQHDIPVDRPVLVHVGRAAQEKNIGFLLEVIAEVREQIADVLLVIAGDGPAIPDLRRQVTARRLQNNVLFVGYLDRGSALKDCYRAGNAFVFASRTETQGLVLLEAMALGVPVISTAVLGTIDILEHAQGAIVVPEDRQRFAAAAIELLGDPARQRTLASGALRDSEAWSSEAMARRIIALYETLAARHRRRPLPPPN